MRIISGIYKSRSIQAPKGDATRPTSDRARETLFNVLVNMIELEDVKVLDLFSGSGAFAFEALSRGAQEALCIEQGTPAINVIRSNASALQIGKELQVVRSDVYKWLLSADGNFDIIFADPPYDDPNLKKLLLKLVFDSRLLTPDSIVIIEHRNGTALVIPESAEIIKERTAGEAHFTFLRLRGNNDPTEQTTSDLPGDI